MRIRDHRADDEPEINLIPLIDVDPVPDHLLRDHHHLRRALGAEAGVAAGQRRAERGPVEGARACWSTPTAATSSTTAKSLRTDVESLKRTIVDVAGDDRDRAGAAARRRAHAAPGRGHRARCAGPARFPQGLDRDRARTEQRASGRRVGTRVT